MPDEDDGPRGKRRRGNRGGKGRNKQKGARSPGRHRTSAQHTSNQEGTSVMSESTEQVTVTLQGNEIHGLTVQIFSIWSKESVVLPAGHLPELRNGLAGIAAYLEEAPVSPEPTPQPAAPEFKLPPAGFTLDTAAFEAMGSTVYDGPDRGDVSSAWHPEDDRVTVYVDTPYGGDYTMAQARQLAADLLAVLAELDATEAVAP